MNGVQAGIVNGKTLQQIQCELTLEKYKDWGGYAEGPCGHGAHPVITSTQWLWPAVCAAVA